ncbi:MAG: carbohydrate kinase [Microbacterium sp.]|jgi:fructokinase|nr:carbohydrate kinase [Microbacterium sp.]
MSGNESVRIVVIGEALMDVVHRISGDIDEAPGGSPANVALTLGRLGRTPTLVTRLGDDDRGRRIRRWLERSGVSAAVVDARRTSTAIAHLDAQGAARYEFDLDWDLDDSASSVVATADLVHIGSVAAVLDPGASRVAGLVRVAREHATITFDPNIRPALIDDPETVRARVADLVAVADVVKASDDDLRWLYPGRDVHDVAQEWQSLGPVLVVVTLGADGAVAVTADSRIRIPAVRSTVVDTVGAGDTFMGALIDGLAAHGETGAAVLRPGHGIRPEALEEILRRAAHAAAITVSRPGADPPRLAELAALAH